MVSLVVDRDEGRGVDDSILEGLHGGGVVFHPHEWLVFVGEIVEWAGDT